MYNKLLADLIKERLNNELEKIKLELFEEDNYAEDIEDSVAAVKKSLAGEVGDSTQYTPVQSTVPAATVEIENQKQIVQEMDLGKHESKKPVPHEIQSEPQDVIVKQDSREEYDWVRISIVGVLLLGLLAGTYLLFVK